MLKLRGAFILIMFRLIHVSVIVIGAVTRELLGSCGTPPPAITAPTATTFAFRSWLTILPDPVGAIRVVTHHDVGAQYCLHRFRMQRARNRGCHA